MTELLATKLIKRHGTKKYGVAKANLLEPNLFKQIQAFTHQVQW